jgi:hypothetical protein
VNRAQGTALAAVLLLAAVALGGCGSADEGGLSATTAASSARPSAKSSATLSSAAAHSARAAGRKACSGLTPLQAAQRYAPHARAAGVRESFIALVANPTPSIENSPGFPRLVAALYASTLPAPQRADAAASCAEELAPPSREG